MRIRVLALSLAGALGLAMPAAAQFPVEYTFTPQIGGALMLADMPESFRVEGTDEILTNREFDPSMLLGAAFGVRLLDIFAVEGNVGWAPVNLASITGNADVVDVNLYTWGVSTLVFAGFERVDPYLALGIGAKTYDFDIPDADLENDFDFNFGGGFQYAFMPNLALRVDVRDHVSRFHSEVPGFGKVTQHDLLMSAGVTFTTARRGALVAMK